MYEYALRARAVLGMALLKSADSKDLLSCQRFQNWARWVLAWMRLVRSPAKGAHLCMCECVLDEGTSQDKELHEGTRDTTERVVNADG